MKKKVHFAKQSTIQIKTTHRITHKRAKSQEELGSSIKNMLLPGQLQPPHRSRILTKKSTMNMQKQQKFCKIVSVQEQAAKQYNQLLKLYETNEWKLKKIIQKELGSNKQYLYSKQILSFLKNPEYQSIKNLNLDLFHNDMMKINDFLIEFNGKKKIRQVEILKDSMINRQSMIRDSATLGEYCKVHQQMRASPLNNQGFTIYDQLRMIRRKYNLPSNIRQSQEKFSQKITQTEQKVFNRIKDQVKSRQKVQKQMFGIILTQRNNEKTNII